MVGRAGRAGQAKLGEAFIIGRGDPEAAFGDWKNICQLLVAPVPSLHSQLLSESAFSSPPAAAASTALSSQSHEAKPLIDVAGQANSQHASAKHGSQSLRGEGNTVGDSVRQPGLLIQDTTHQPSQAQINLSGASQGSIRLASSQPSHAQSFTMTTTTSQQQQPQQQQSQTSVAQSACVIPPARHPTVVASLSSQQGAQLSTVQSGSSQLAVQSSSNQVTHDESSGLTQQLQRMLLEGIANGSIVQARDINHLIQSTLLSHQAQYSRMQLATKTALAALRCDCASASSTKYSSHSGSHPVCMQSMTSK